jgi:lysophospholipase L1-like esterase
MQRELRWLRQNFPDMFVLVVGVTDMGGDDPALQERLQRIREEQRLTALAEGCAFWDAYLAMGGERAMARWAAQQPSLARPDQAHMSLEGSQLFARMLLKALMEDYQTYTHGL